MRLKLSPFFIAFLACSAQACSEAAQQPSDQRATSSDTSELAELCSVFGAPLGDFVDASFMDFEDSLFVNAETADGIDVSLTIFEFQEKTVSLPEGATLWLTAGEGDNKVYARAVAGEIEEDNSESRPRFGWTLAEFEVTATREWDPKTQRHLPGDSHRCENARLTGEVSLEDAVRVFDENQQ